MRNRSLSCDSLPMKFVVGHENIINMLRKSVGEGKPAQAYLFEGKEGVGKKKTALLFARILNCPQCFKHSPEDCSVCKRLVTFNHPDLIIESPERGMIRIEGIRRIQSFFKFAPVECDYRIALVDDAHMMNRSAQNAILKTLEEPPQGRLLVLVTSETPPVIVYGQI